MWKWPFLLLACLDVHAAAYAVDGYKDLRFGMTQKEIRGLCPVPLAEVPGAGPGSGFTTMLYTEEFPFNGSSHLATFGFNGDSFKMFQVHLKAAEFDAVFRGLKEKYGEPDFGPDFNEELFRKAVDRILAASLKPGAMVVGTFDWKSIKLIARQDGVTGNPQLILTYVAKVVSGDGSAVNSNDL
ncbi:MAG: hypothetical protein DWI04_06960 [Planctomycetota bacterium]|jgi:hypothetical protein|nr:MAG: hypothetical protein DWI04_06960 [Planctomycetota bacterium]